MGSPLFFGLLLPFAAAYLTDRTRNWWALIPGGVMLFLALTTLLVDSAGGEWVGHLVPLHARGQFPCGLLEQPGTHLGSAGCIYPFGRIKSCAGDGLELVRTGAYFGAIFLFAVALPFFVIYFRSAANWWAIIPAGVMTVLAIITALAIAGFIRNENQGGYANAILMGGLAVPFAVLWLRTRESLGKGCDHCARADGCCFHFLRQLLADILARGHYSGRPLSVLHGIATEDDLSA